MLHTHTQAAGPFTVRRLEQINVAVTESSGNVSLTPAVGRSTLHMMEDEKQGGRTTTRCGGMAAGEAGSRPSQEKTTTWTLAFFLSLQTPTTGRGLLLPL